MTKKQLCSLKLTNRGEGNPEHKRHTQMHSGEYGWWKGGCVWSHVPQPPRQRLIPIPLQFQPNLTGEKASQTSKFL